MTGTSYRDIEATEVAEPNVQPQSGRRPRPPRKGSSPLAILFLAANPAKTSQLALDEEARTIGARLRGGDLPTCTRFTTRWAVQCKDLQQALLEERPTLVHLSGHGSGDDGLVFHEDGGRSKAVSTEALRDLFSMFRDSIRVVVLSACYSAIQAEAIASELDVVIGMRARVTDRAALLFSEAFYQALAFGRSVGMAFNLGVNAIKLDGVTHNDDIPVLLQLRGVDAHTLQFSTQTAVDQPQQHGTHRWLVAIGLAVAALGAVAYGVFRWNNQMDSITASLPDAGAYRCEVAIRSMVGCAIENHPGQRRIVFATPEDDGILVHRVEGALVSSGAGCWTAVMETAFSNGVMAPTHQPGGTIACCRSSTGWSGHWTSADGSAQLPFRLWRGGEQR